MTFGEWRLKRGYTRDLRQKEAWGAACQATVKYLWALWYGHKTWDHRRGPLTANALWAELNQGRDKEKAEAIRAERERCAQKAYDAIVTLSSRELAEDVAAFIRNQGAQCPTD